LCYVFYILDRFSLRCECEEEEEAPSAAEAARALSELY
jgi:hypothetical protein